MVDVVDPATRRRMMAGIRSTGTAPEKLIRNALHRRGFRFALSRTRLPGKPDIVMPRWRIVIFVHGCFWHWHGCRLSKMPSTNTQFWKAKLGANQQRDVRVLRELHALSWRTAVIWECATRGSRALEALPHLLDQLEHWVRHQPDTMALELGEPEVASTTKIPSIQKQHGHKNS
jgi:DNA mismatch endonuclease, patch repair protein